MAADIEAGESAAPAKKGVPKLFILVGAAALVVLLGGVGLYFFLSAGSASSEVAATEGEHGATAETAHTFIFNLPAMVVNLSSEGDTEAFMRLTIALEVANEEVMTTIQPSMAKVMDAFQVYLRELRKSDLEGSAGIYRLKEELTRRVNVAIYPSRIESILFREILVQ